MKKRLQVSLISLLIIVFMIASAGCGQDTLAASQIVSSQTVSSQEAETDSDADGVEPDAEKDLNATDAEKFLADIPEWTGFAFCYVNDNQPDFRL